VSVRAVAGREWRALFLTPFGWGALAIFQFVATWLFLVQLDAYTRLATRLAAVPEAPGVTDLVIVPLFAQGGVLLLLFMPLLTMRLVSGERRTGTLALLYAAPLGSSQIIMGKYLAAWLLGMLLVTMLAAMPGALWLAGVGLDLGKVLAGLLGTALLVSALTAIGLLMSTLAGQPGTAAVSSLGLMLLLWVTDFAVPDEDGNTVGFAWLSLREHFRPFLHGLVDARQHAAPRQRA